MTTPQPDCRPSSLTGDRFRPWLPLAMTLGEGPLWDTSSDTLYWVNIEAGECHRQRLSDRRHDVTQLDEAVTCLGLVADDDGLIAGTRSGIWQLLASGEKRSLRAANPEDTATHRFNDGRVGPGGRLWIGTMNDDKKTPDAGLYSFDGQQLIRHKTDIAISNGLAFSPDNQWLYHSDTPSRIVYRHAFDAQTGQLGPAERWIDFNQIDCAGNPDGATVDAGGDYWCALFGGFAVVRFDADGRFKARYPLDAPNPTMCTFGGSDLRTLFVTTAREGMDRSDLDRWPDAGSLFALRSDVAGRDEPRFRSVI